MSLPTDHHGVFIKQPYRFRKRGRWFGRRQFYDAFNYSDDAAWTGNAVWNRDTGFIGVGRIISNNVYGPSNTFGGYVTVNNMANYGLSRSEKRFEINLDLYTEVNASANNYFWGCYPFTDASDSNDGISLILAGLTTGQFRVQVGTNNSANFALSTGYHDHRVVFNYVSTPSSGVGRFEIDWYIDGILRHSDPADNYQVAGFDHVGLLWNPGNILNADSVRLNSIKVQQ